MLYTLSVKRHPILPLVVHLVVLAAFVLVVVVPTVKSFAAMVAEMAATQEKMNQTVAELLKQNH